MTIQIERGPFWHLLTLWSQKLRGFHSVNIDLTVFEIAFFCQLIFLNWKFWFFENLFFQNIEHFEYFEFLTFEKYGLWKIWLFENFDYSKICTIRKYGLFTKFDFNKKNYFFDNLDFLKILDFFNFLDFLKKNGLFQKKKWNLKIFSKYFFSKILTFQKFWIFTMLYFSTIGIL